MECRLKVLEGGKVRQVYSAFQDAAKSHRGLHLGMSHGRQNTYCGGVFEQLARYTMRYKESDLYLGLYSSYCSYNFCLLYFYSTFLYSLLTSTSSSIVAVLIAKAGHVWVN